MKHKERKNKVIALDFDGILNKLLLPMQWIMYYSRPDDLIERAHLDKLRSFIVKLYSYLPFILDNKIINYLPRNTIIISGRTIYSRKAKEKLLELGFKFVFFRPSKNISELEWKLKMCKSLGITEFYDDRPFIIEELKRYQINAKEWKKKRS